MPSMLNTERGCIGIRPGSRPKRGMRATDVAHVKSALLCTCSLHKIMPLEERIVAMALSDPFSLGQRCARMHLQAPGDKDRNAERSGQSLLRAAPAALASMCAAASPLLWICPCKHNRHVTVHKSILDFEITVRVSHHSAVPKSIACMGAELDAYNQVDQVPGVERQGKLIMHLQLRGSAVLGSDLCMLSSKPDNLPRAIISALLVWIGAPLAL